MTYNHPVWSPATATDVKAALIYLDRAKAAATRDDREAKYVAAAGTLFGDGDPAKKDVRGTAYRDAMRSILAAYPDDEAKLFTSLAMQSVRALTDEGAWKPRRSRKRCTSTSSIQARCII